MPRYPRKQSASDIYHVVTRGVNKRALFEDDEDREKFVSLLVAQLARHNAKLFAWCLMTNHVHLLLKAEFEELSELMRELKLRYSLYFNEKHGRKGHLYEERFKSEPVESDAYFLTVVRYIHQNPVKALIVPDCRYPWSSYGEYLGAPYLVDADFVLHVFEGLPDFLQFHSVVAFEDRCLEVKLQMDDGEARSYAGAVLGEDKLAGICRMPKDERERCLRILKCCMMPNAQIAAITGVSLSSVKRA